MDPQAISLILGAIGTSVAAVLGGLALYRKASAPHSVVLGALKLLWNWLEFTRPDEELFDRMRAGGSIASVIKPRVRRAVLRIIDPKALQDENRSVGQEAREIEEVEEVAEDDRF